MVYAPEEFEQDNTNSDADRIAGEVAAGAVIVGAKVGVELAKVPGEFLRQCFIETATLR